MNRKVVWDFHWSAALPITAWTYLCYLISAIYDGGLLWMVGLFATFPFVIAFHEYGHVAASNLLNGRTKRVLFRWFGAGVELDLPETVTPYELAFVSAAGFFASTITTFIGFGVMEHTTGVWEATGFMVGLLSVAMLVSNALPVPGTDGYKLVQRLWRGVRQR